MTVLPEASDRTLFGQLAVDKEFQGQGHAKSLLLFALWQRSREAPFEKSELPTATPSMVDVSDQKENVATPGI